MRTIVGIMFKYTDLNLIVYASCYLLFNHINSNSNWTFVALNLPIQGDSKVHLHLSRFLNNKIGDIFPRISVT